MESGNEVYNIGGAVRLCSFLMLCKILRIMRGTSSAKFQSVIVARVPSRMATSQIPDVAAKIAKNRVQNVRTKEVGNKNVCWFVHAKYYLSPPPPPPPPPPTHTHTHTQSVAIETMWSDILAVIMFMRRFG